jgi:hypothetical protein
LIASITWLQQSLAQRQLIGIKQRCLPEIFCCFRWGNLEIGPPRDLVAMAMQVQMMIPAQRDGEFVADLASERARLDKFEVMCVAGRSPTN